jgi:hypothetical protein
MSDITRVTVDLPSADIEALKAIAAARNVNLTDALRESIWINKLLVDQEAAAAKVLIERPDGSFERIVRK